MAKNKQTKKTGNVAAPVESETTEAAPVGVVPPVEEVLPVEMAPIEQRAPRAPQRSLEELERVAQAALARVKPYAVPVAGDKVQAARRALVTLRNAGPDATEQQKKAYREALLALPSHLRAEVSR